MQPRFLFKQKLKGKKEMNELTKENERYVKIMQSPSLNQIPYANVKNVEVGKRDDDIELVLSPTLSLRIEDYTSISYNSTKGSRIKYNVLANGIPPAAWLLFYIMLAELTNNRTEDLSVKISIIEYINLRGLSKNSYSDTVEQLGRDLAILSKIGYSATEKHRGKDVKIGGRKLCGGTAILEDGHIKFNFNMDFEEQFKTLEVLDMPEDFFKLDLNNNPHSLAMSLWIVQNYRINEGKKTLEMISVATLLNKCPGIPSSQKVADSDRHYKKRITAPFFKNLDALRMNYTFLDANNNEIDKEAVDIKTFLKAKVKMDYSNFPENLERLAKRSENIAAAKKRKESALQKATDMIVFQNI